MANKLLSALGLLSMMALLIGGAAPATKARTPAKSIADVPITHHFSQYIPSLGALDGSVSANPPIVQTMPESGGIAISQISWVTATNNPQGVSVRIDGNEVFRSIRNGEAPNGFGGSAIVPPLIVRPGSVVEVGAVPSFSVVNATISGYTLPASYFGE